MDNGIKLNQANTTLVKFLRTLNRVACALGWVFLFSAIFIYMSTENLMLSLLVAMYVPVRYFFFDVSPEKKQIRPHSLNRDTAFVIFVRYLSISFPVPQGNILASIYGFIAAVFRAYINGYGLLVFDTFTFFFRDKYYSDVSDEFDDLPKTSSISELESDIAKEDNEERAERLNIMLSDAQQYYISQKLNEWDFPKKRYILSRHNYYFENREVGNLPLDDEYLITPEYRKKRKEKS